MKSMTQTASGLLSTFGMDENAANMLDSAIESAMRSLSDEIYRSADSRGIYQDDLQVISKSTKKILASVKDYALSPRDVSVISSSLGNTIKTVEKYTGTSDNNSLEGLVEVKTLLTVIRIFISMVTLLGIVVIVTRVLGKSKGLDVVYFILMLLLTAAFIACTIAGNKELEINVFRLTLWPFIGVLCALPMKLLPNIKRTVATAPALICANCGGKLEASERFCSHCGTPVSQAKREATASVCLTCGASVGDGYAFCPNCGSPR